ncbi:MAG: aspartate aminotransferase family protein [Thermomicrobiales bacterium]|nr:aspartate aminotransferase family protein [Thermomicrobiales bacterium]
MTPGGVNTTIRQVGMPLVFTEAHGPYITDADGKRYLDYHAAFGAIVLGHNDEKVNRAATGVLSKLDLVGVGTTVQEVELAAKIVEHVPSAEMVHICVTGTEATFHAIRVSRAITGRRKIIKFQGCFHGGHDYLLLNVISSAEKVGQKDPGSAGMLPETIDETLIADFNDLASVERHFQDYPNQVAAVILEPIPHNIGAVLPQPGFLEGLRQITSDHGAVLIFDEVITGFRHGLGGMQGITGVTPDLTTMGKAMANGYPIAALAGRKEIMERFATAGGDVFFAGTYNAHPMCTAAALETISAFESGEVYQHTFGLGEYLRSELGDIVERARIPAQVGGYGSVWVLYFVDPSVEVRSYTDLLQNDDDSYVRFHRGMVDRGVFMLPLNLKRNHISASHTRKDIDMTLEAAEATLRELARS